MNAAHAPIHLNLHVLWMVAGGMADNTIEDRQGILCRFNADLPCDVSEATSDQISAWLGRDDWGPSTKHTYYGHLWGYCRWLELTGRIDRNPMITVKRPRMPRRLPRPVAPDVLTDVLTRAREPWRTCVILATFAGLRCCEIATIRREDITPRRLVVLGKGNKRASVPTHPAVWATVKDLPPGLVIEAVGGRADAERISVDGAGYFRRTLRLPGVSLHRFRHLFGTMIYRQTRDLLVTRDALRHSSVSTTQGYAALEDEATEAAVAQLPMPLCPTCGVAVGGRACKHSPPDPDQVAA